MKHKLPRWLIVITCMFLLFCGYVGYLITHCNNAFQTLTTLQGTPANLSGIQLKMDTLLSEYQDHLASTFTFGDSLDATHTFHARPAKRDSGMPVVPSIYPDLTQTDTNYTGYLDYKKISDKINYSYRSGLSDSILPFPYVELKTPDNYYVEYDKDGEILMDSLELEFGTTAYVTLGDSRYFSITSADSDKTISYQVNGGIFKESKDKIDCVYDYPFTPANGNTIIDLLAIEDLNCLGLVVKEGDFYSLKLIDPKSKDEKSSFTLANIPTPDSSRLTPSFRVSYHNATKTLIVSSNYYTTKTVNNKNEEVYADYFYLNENHEDYKEAKEAFDKTVSTTSTLTCYTLKDFDTLTPCASFDVPMIGSKLHSSTDLLVNAEDYLYKDGILYLVAQSKLSLQPFPYLIALKGNDVLYEGYLQTDLSEDYRINRKGIDDYTLRHKKQQPDPNYAYYQRTTSHLKLSLSN